MQNNPVNWFEIYVQDMERARKFYENVFGVTLKKLETVTPEIWAFPGATMRESMESMLDAERAVRLEHIRNDRIDL